MRSGSVLARALGTALAAVLMTSQLLADVREVRLAVKGAT